MVPMAVKHTTTMSASITAYSTAVGPSSSLRKFTMLSAKFFMSLSSRVRRTPFWGVRRRLKKERPNVSQTRVKGQPCFRLSSDTPWHALVMVTASSCSFGNPAVQRCQHHTHVLLNRLDPWLCAPPLQTVCLCPGSKADRNLSDCISAISYAPAASRTTTRSLLLKSKTQFRPVKKLWTTKP